MDMTRTKGELNDDIVSLLNGDLMVHVMCGEFVGGRRKIAGAISPAKTFLPAIIQRYLVNTMEFRRRYRRILVPEKPKPQNPHPSSNALCMVDDGALWYGTVVSGVVDITT